MEEGIKIALFNQMLSLEKKAKELDEMMAKGEGKHTYDFKLNKTVEEVFSNTMAQQDSLYLAFSTIGIAKEYIDWSIGVED